MFRDQFGEFVCGYWGLKSSRNCVTEFIKIQVVGTARKLSETEK